MASSGFFNVYFLSVQVNFALAAVINAKQRTHDFRASGNPISPGNGPKNFAFAPKLKETWSNTPGCTGF